MNQLDVLVVESSPGVGWEEIEALQAAGHRVHRCHEPGERGFPCRAVAGTGPCPLDTGVDVGMLVRRGIIPRATEHERAVSCLVREGVPLVEQGSDVLDPYAPFLTTRVDGEDGDVASACESAVETGYGPLRAAIWERIDGHMAAEGHRADEVRIDLRRSGDELRVVLQGPSISTSARHAIGVRVLDAVRAAGRTHGRIDVEYVATQGVS